MAALGTRLLKLTINGTEHTEEVSKVAVTSTESDSDFVTFYDAANGGGREYRLNVIAAQDPEPGSFWDLVFSNAGQTVPFVINPHGNETPTATQPHFAGNATITEPDGDFLGGEADASTTARFTIEVEWVLTGKPTKITSGA
jgi:hypothetical protein